MSKARHISYTCKVPTALLHVKFDEFYDKQHHKDKVQHSLCSIDGNDFEGEKGDQQNQEEEQPQEEERVEQPQEEERVEQPQEEERVEQPQEEERVEQNQEEERVDMKRIKKWRIGKMIQLVNGN